MSESRVASSGCLGDVSAYRNDVMSCWEPIVVSFRVSQVLLVAFAPRDACGLELLP